LGEQDSVPWNHPDISECVKRCNNIILSTPVGNIGKVLLFLFLMFRYPETRHGVFSNQIKNKLLWIYLTSKSLYAKIFND